VHLLTGARELFELQQIDTDIGVRQRRLEKIGAELQEGEALIAARGELEGKGNRLHTLEGEQKSLDWDVENTRNRITSLETRMYGDQVSNPRELQSIVAEIAHLKDRQKELEDRELGVMEEVEEARGDAERQGATVQELQAKWEDVQGHLLDEKRKIEEAFPGLEAKRRDHESTVPEASRKIYDRLRGSLGGLAIVRAEQGMCTGCRISLPTHLVQQVRADKQFTYCGACGRLLFAA